MSKSLLAIILSVIIIALLLIIWRFVPPSESCHDFKVFKKIILSKALPQIKSGDLVLFSSNRYNIITRTFGDAIFSHIGMVIIIDGVPHIYELVRNDRVAPKIMKRGILITPLAERVSDYPGYCYIASLVSPLTDSQLLKFDEFMTKPIKFIKLNTLLLHMLGIRTEERFCTEMIADLLKEIEISDVPAASPMLSLHANIVKLCNDITYKKPVQLIPDSLLIDDIRNDNNFIDFC